MFRVLTTSLLLLAAAPAMADSLFDMGSLFDPGVDLTAIVGNGGTAQGTTTINPEFANLNAASSGMNYGYGSASGSGYGYGGLPGMDSAAAQTIASDPKLRVTLDFFLRCIAQYGSIGSTNQPQDDLFGFGTSQPTGTNIADTSDPTVRFCIETAKGQVREQMIHAAQATLTAIEQQQQRQRQQDLMMVMGFLGQNGGDDEMLRMLPILLGNGDASSLLLGGF
ncbi:MAG: hypothetical protein KDD51_07605 [Bdellovibrionales bacterium]|nr:hypothetical protein [Bdellovibrionales bacterium]